MDLTKQIPKATIKVLRSHNYNNFEFTLEAPENSTLQEINELRKDAERLTDEAVRQYKQANFMAMSDCRFKETKEALEKEVRLIKEKFYREEWTPEQKAKIKALDDWDWRPYDYDDDFSYENR